MFVIYLSPILPLEYYQYSSLTELYETDETDCYYLETRETDISTEAVMNEWSGVGESI